jgi:hypothetical protein
MKSTPGNTHAQTTEGRSTSLPLISEEEMF